MDLMNLENPFSQKNYRAFHQKVKGLPDETKKETPFSTKLLKCREESALVAHANEKKRLYEINELPCAAECLFGRSARSRSGSLGRFGMSSKN